MNHLWYLTEDLVGLAFFCDDVPDERKLAMQSALQKPARKQTVKRLGAKNIAEKIGKIGAGRFFTERSRELFEKLTIDSAFMTDYPPQTWSGLADYKNAQRTVSIV